MTSSTPPASRLAAIDQARQRILHDELVWSTPWVAPEVQQSWQRCLAQGLHPEQPVVFDAVSRVQLTRTLEANRALIEAARPVLEHLGRAIVNTRYFALLTNADGVVIAASGAIDHGDRHAHLISRIGTDLSERSIGTTAIGMALTERRSVWLHRGEHFFEGNGVYSCAGAPLFGPDGQCVGMLDVTGIHAVERPELRHLVTQSATHVENALLLRQPHALLLRLNWPGNTLGSDADGLLGLDEDGRLLGCNSVARQMLPDLMAPSASTLTIGDVFGTPVDPLFDAARASVPFELPLWTGLRLRVQAIRAQSASARPVTGVPLRDVEASLIHQAVQQANGNVMQAARALGISRATVYRKLGQRTGASPAPEPPANT